jgi:hypothetical protein
MLRSGPASESDVARGRAALQSAVGRTADSEAGVVAGDERTLCGGMGWICFRHLFWTAFGEGPVVGLPFTYVTSMGRRNAGGVPYFRLIWTDRGDDALPGSQSVLPPNPWFLGVLSRNEFTRHLEELSQFLPLPSGRSYMAGARELATRAQLPVREWKDCPLCVTALSIVIEGAAKCDNCDRVFSDPHCRPSVDRRPQAFGHPTGVLPEAPLLGELEEGTADLPQVWLVKPISDTTSAPDVCREQQIMWAASGYVPLPGRMFISQGLLDFLGGLRPEAGD